MRGLLHNILSKQIAEQKDTKSPISPQKPRKEGKEKSLSPQEKTSPDDFTGLPPIITFQQKSEIGKYLALNPKVEVEASFGSYERDRFIPGVTVTQFNSVLGYLLSLGDTGIWGASFIIPQTRVTIEESQNGGQWRGKRITDSLGNVIWQEKIRNYQDNIDNHSWGYRISKSTERNTDKGPSNFIPNFRRVKQRVTFMVLPKEHELYGIQFDLTRVRETKQIFDKKNQETKEVTEFKYEVEIERKVVIDVSVFEKAISRMIYVMQKASDQNQLMTRGDVQHVMDEHNRLFAGEMQKSLYQIPVQTMVSNYWNKPTNIKITDLINPENDYFVTLKVDGVRMQILITSDGIFSCSPPRDLWKIGGYVKSLGNQPTLLDAEVYTKTIPGTNIKETTYYVFDVLFVNGRDVRPEKFQKRLDYIKEIVPKIRLYRGEEVVVKQFYHSSLYNDIDRAFSDAIDMEERGINLDGLIFQSHVWYKNNFTKKWKDETDLTIDFSFQRENKSNKFVLCVFDKGGVIPFLGSRDNPVDIQYVELNGGILEGIPNSAGIRLNPPADGLVVECSWDSENKIFVPRRYRDDKPFPNAERTAADVWDDIMQPISEETIRGDTLTTMRKFHNAAKKHFLTQEFGKGDVIMDWGSGRGGDLLKWDQMGLSTVYTVEPNDENFAELERRLEKMDIKTQIVPFRGGAEETSSLKKVVKKPLAGITSFFSLTFFGKDRKVFEGMIRTIDELLPVGGKFVGIVMDGGKVRERLEMDETATEGEALLYDSPAFSISQVSEFESSKIEEGKNEIEIVIKDPGSMVDQTEWLFYFDIFVQALAEIGLSLEYDGFLDESTPELVIGKNKRPGNVFNTLPEYGKIFSSMNRYFSFKRVSKEGVKAKKVKMPKSKTPKSPKIPSFSFAGDKSLEVVYPQVAKTENSTVRLIHAILSSFSSYQNSSDEENTAKVLKVMRMMGSKLDSKLYEKIMGEKNKKQASKLRLSLIQGEDIDETICLDILSHLLSINVFVFTSTNGKVNMNFDPNTFECHPLTVIIYKNKNNYGVVIDKTSSDIIYSVYRTTNPLVARLVKEASEE